MFSVFRKTGVNNTQAKSFGRETVWLFCLCTNGWKTFVTHVVDVCMVSTLWICCVLRLSASENHLAHAEHPNGFFPVWIRLWVVKDCLCLENFPHSVHLYLLLWLFLCCLEYVWTEKYFLLKLQIHLCYGESMAVPQKAFVLTWREDKINLYKKGHLMRTNCTHIIIIIHETSRSIPKPKMKKKS